MDEENEEEMDLEELERAFSEAATTVSHAKRTPSKSRLKTITKSLTLSPTRMVDVKTPGMVSRHYENSLQTSLL